MTLPVNDNSTKAAEKHSFARLVGQCRLTVTVTPQQHILILAKENEPGMQIDIILQKDISAIIINVWDEETGSASIRCKIPDARAKAASYLTADALQELIAVAFEVKETKYKSELESAFTRQHLDACLTVALKYELVTRGFELLEQYKGKIRIRLHEAASELCAAMGILNIPQGRAGFQRNTLSKIAD